VRPGRAAQESSERITGCSTRLIRQRSVYAIPSSMPGTMASEISMHLAAAIVMI
jgi:hypothetical protein